MPIRSRAAYAAVLIFQLIMQPAMAWEWSHIFTPGTIFPLFANHPLLRDKLDEDDLPRPVGVSLGRQSQQQEIAISNLRFKELNIGSKLNITLPTQLSEIPAVSNFVTGGESRIRQDAVRIDLWVLPILNVFYMPAEGDGKVSLDGKWLGSERQDHVRIAYSLDTEAVGLSLAGGYKSYWASLTHTWVEIAGHSPQKLRFDLDTRVFSIRAGYKPSSTWNFWLGANHLHMGRVTGELQGLAWLADVDSLSSLPLLTTLLDTLVDVVPAQSDLISLTFTSKVRPVEHWGVTAGLGYWLSPRLGLQFEAGADESSGRLIMAELQLRIP